MKTINISVDEATWDKAESFASLNKTSVSNLLLDYLHHVTSSAPNREAARAQLIELCQSADGEVGPRQWTRDDLYGR